ncbi:MAG: U3 snoRNP-associated protein Esf2 [Amphiamblys sp. WSBS2006]|nr:MAG: U3 snoRNP-associated protein Esf2 [Amphiamblys sp. WSBS2006]OIR57638.1 MAG: U3 snoRNP-associated protein Esf2 [Amphiamblys sp. WSBS2006]
MESNFTARGVVYMSRIPSFLSPRRLKELLERMGKVARMHFTEQKNKSAGSRGLKEGWIEFEKNEDAQNAEYFLNGREIGGRKNRWNGVLWTIKYIDGFRWSQLQKETEISKMDHRERIRLEIEQEKEENEFYRRNVRKCNAGLL